MTHDATRQTGGVATGAAPPPHGDAPPQGDPLTPASEGERPATPFDKEVSKAFAYVLRSTNARPQTEAEVRTKLAGREIEPDVAEAALRQAREVGAVDDAAFARAWVADRGEQRGYGLARLRRELDRRGVADDVAEAALAALAERDELSTATDLARRRAAAMPARLEPEAVARRLIGYLARRGYPPGLAQRVAIDVSGLGREWD